MTIKDDKTYREIDSRIEELIDKGTALGGMDMLSENEQEELKVLSEAAYDWGVRGRPAPVAREAVADCRHKGGGKKQRLQAERCGKSHRGVANNVQRHPARTARPKLRHGTQHLP